jgi:hypothetical protein
MKVMARQCQWFWASVTRTIAFLLKDEAIDAL